MKMKNLLKRFTLDISHSLCKSFSIDLVLASVFLVSRDIESI